MKVEKGDSHSIIIYLSVEITKQIHLDPGGAVTTSSVKQEIENETN